MSTHAPLDDPRYEPRYRPLDGKPHPVVKKWGAASQLRWFQRFWGTDEMPTLYAADVADHYCSSVEHKGSCCDSCIEDREYGFDAIDEHCCCQALRAR